MKLNNNDDSHNSGLNLLIYNMLLDIESHPTWVCGLKLLSVLFRIRLFVTPYVGVWIETIKEENDFVKLKSHPTWVCGLKHPHQMSRLFQKVTPYVGVWIETSRPFIIVTESFVTPYVGVWIETSVGGIPLHGLKVTPYVGVWIETLSSKV